MTAPSDHSQLQSQPGVATAEEGFVILDGPDGVAVTMTASAASQTGYSLLCAAQQAEQQKAARGEGNA